MRLFIRNTPIALARKDGFTLTEMVMTIVILGVTLVILVPFYQAIEHSPDPMIRQRAVALGQALMDEILAKKWDENTPLGGGPIDSAFESSGRGTAAAAATIGRDAPEAAADRRIWDDVDDYDGLDQSTNFTDQDNNSFTLANYRRWVTVTYIPSNTNPISAANPAGTKNSAQSTDSKRIVVSVTSPLNETFTFVAVACNF